MYDDDIMLPEGYQEGMSLDDYNKSLEQGEPAAQAEPQQQEQQAEPAEEAPTTTEGQPAEEAPGAASQLPTTEQPPTTGPEAGQPGNKLKFTVTVDHSDTDVELDPAELPSMYQKAQVTDRVQQRLTMAQPDLDLARKAREAAQKLGYKTAEEMLDGVNSRLRSAAVEELTAEGMGKKAAEMLADMRYGEQPDAAAAPANAASPQDGRNSTPPARDFSGEIAALRAAYPETASMATLPDEVMRACVAEGKPLVAAYAVWDARQKVAEAEKLRKENETLKQNAANAAAAPVKGATGGGDTNQKPLDPFLAGFEDY